MELGARCRRARLTGFLTTIATAKREMSPVLIPLSSYQSLYTIPPYPMRRRDVSAWKYSYC